MSSIHNRIVTTFSASAGNALAVMGQISSGMLNIGRSSAQGSGQVSQMERSMRAFGTTIRYAIAGTAIFAGPTAIRNLSQLQYQLGLMAAIGDNISSRNLNQFFHGAIRGSEDSLTPVNEFNDAMVNFLSTVQGFPSSKIPSTITEIARAAQIAQTPVEDLTKAVTTMEIAFGKRVTPQGIQSLVAMYQHLITTVPGGRTAGPQIVGQFGQLAQVTRAAGGTPADLFSLFSGILRAGIPPSQAGRGLQYLIQTLGFPAQQTTESQRALASVGIVPGTTMRLQERIRRVFARAGQLGMQGASPQALSQISHLDLDDPANAGLDTMPTSQALAQFGIKGQGSVFLGTIFHRIHALRSALALGGQMSTGQYTTDLTAMTRLQNDHAAQVHELRGAWEKLARQAKLRQAGIELSNLGLVIARDFAPLLNFVAGRGVGGGAKYLQDHANARRGVEYGTAGVLGALFLNRLRGGAGLGAGTLGRVLGRGLPAAAAGENLLTGQIPKGTASDPLFVVVMGNVFGGGGGRGIPGGVPPVVGAPGEWTGMTKYGGRGFFRTLPLYAMGGMPDTVERGQPVDRRQLLLRAFLRRSGGLFGMFQHPALKESAGEADVMLAYHLGQITSAQAERRLQRLATPTQLRQAGLTRISTNQFGARGAPPGALGPTPSFAALSGMLTLDINYNQPDGTRQTKRVHVRVDNWGNGNVPQHRGKAKTGR